LRCFAEEEGAEVERVEGRGGVALTNAIDGRRVSTAEKGGGGGEKGGGGEGVGGGRGEGSASSSFLVATISSCSASAFCSRRFGMESCSSA
jgi:hypothetical protein